MAQTYGSEQRDDENTESGADTTADNEERDEIAEENKGWSAIDFWTTCGANGIAIDVETMQILQRYHDELLYWNARVNMISRKDENHVWDRHILHSLCLLKYVDFPTKARVLDVGTGGGLPGVPIKILRPDIKMLLTDSIKKKVTIADMLAKHTGMKDVSGRQVRVEELADDQHYRQRLDVIISRGVARISTLLDWVLPLLATNGTCAFLKGGDLTEEIEEAMSNHKKIVITRTDIDMFGAPWFKENNKCVIIVRRSA